MKNKLNVLLLFFPIDRVPRINWAKVLAFYKDKNNAAEWKSQLRGEGEEALFQLLKFYLKFFSFT